MDDLDYVFKTLIAGGTAGCVAKTAIAPFDRVKILFQTLHPNFVHHSGSIFGVFRGAKEIYLANGIFGLFRGHSATILRIFPYSAIQYMSYEQYKKLLMPKEKTPFLQILSGSLAGATSVFFTYPLDIIRTRLAYQVQKHEVSSVALLIRQMSKESPYPVLAFYKGFMPTMYGILPYAGVSFYTFETLKSLTAPILVEHKNIKNLVCGMIAGAISQTVAYPLDVIRRRLQLQHPNSHLPRTNTSYQTFLSILKHKGWRGFYIGLSVNYIKVVPANGISFLVYEFMKRKMEI